MGYKRGFKKLIFYKRVKTLLRKIYKFKTIIISHFSGFPKFLFSVAVRLNDRFLKKKSRFGGKITL